MVQKIESSTHAIWSKMSKVDPAVFYSCDQNGTLAGIVACHADDLLWAGNKDFEEKVIQSVRKNFNIGKEIDTPFKYFA